MTSSKGVFNAVLINVTFESAIQSEWSRVRTNPTPPSHHKAVKLKSESEITLSF